MALTHLIDLPAAAIVVGGTMLSTLMRAGWGDVVITAKAVGNLPRHHFSSREMRARLATQVQEIRQDGLLRAHSNHSGDEEFDEVTDALLEQRKLSALVEGHAIYKARRQAATEVAVRTLAQAAELAPAFGLVGTLVSLSQLPSGGLEQGQLMGAISMAVLTTLYGLLTANLVFAPLSRMVERAAEQEERDRQEVLDWLAGQIAPVIPAPSHEPGRHEPGRAAA